MPALLFDTATDELVVAIADGASLLCGTVRAARAQQLLEVVDETLGTAGLTLADIDRVGVGTGPGGFTGLRIGVTTARGLASALQVPLHSLSTLAAVAQPRALSDPRAVVWASIDARRCERFLRSYRCISGIAGFTMVPASELLVVPAQHEAAIVGDEPVVRDMLTPAALAAVAADAGARDPLEVVPQYGREPDATPPSGGGSPADVPAQAAAPPDVAPELRA